MIKVLVVDDHDLVRTGITRMLADIEGLQVVGQADCGEDCLKLARELKPDVVLMDVKMPGIGGQRYISPQIAQQLALKSFQPQQHDSPFDSLSEREIQIALMIANCHKVQSISDKLCLSPKTVNTYRYRIFEKLSITSDVELALLAVRHGMVDAAS
ncbi:TPA: LuxR C-terminal-related transcriptional regulator [Pseudomonas aeruginosa]